MDPGFWHERWRRSETGWHRDEFNLHLVEHWPQLGVAPGARVFVPLCGKSLDLLWLAGEGYRVVGVELSPIAVEGFFAHHGLRPEVEDRPPFRGYRVDELEILCGDFYDLTPDRLTGVTAVFDRASLVAMPAEMRPRYAAHLSTLLGPDARVLLVTLDYPQAEMAGPPFSVPESEVRALLGGTFDVRRCAQWDVLAENPGFRRHGLSRMTEEVYLLRAPGA